MMASSRLLIADALPVEALVLGGEEETCCL
jgi:hypothetical protein